MAGKRFPESFEGWEEMARTRMDEEKFRYVSAGSGYGNTSRENVEAFRRWKLVPRVLRDVGERSSRISLFGRDVSAPVLLAPVRALRYIHPDGEVGAAKAAAEAGVPFVLSTFASTSIEEVARVMGNAPRWFQLYPGNDQEVMDSLVRRAEASGYSAIVVTVDKAESYPQYDGPRTHDFDRYGTEVYFSDPVFRSKFGGEPEKHSEAAMKLWREIRLRPGFTLNDLHRLVGQTKLPVVPKGILHPGDAELAVENGATGLIVSNHGGRSLDGEIASLDALVDVQKVAGDKFPIFLDSGVRSGTDIVKAIALGAKAVLIGKSYLYGLGFAGQTGVKAVLDNITQEFDSAQAICGARTVDDINSSMIAREESIVREHPHLSYK